MTQREIIMACMTGLITLLGLTYAMVNPWYEGWQDMVEKEPGLRKEIQKLEAARDSIPDRFLS